MLGYEGLVAPGSHGSYGGYGGYGMGTGYGLGGSIIGSILGGGYGSYGSCSYGYEMFRKADGTIDYDAATGFELANFGMQLLAGFAGAGIARLGNAISNRKGSGGNPQTLEANQKRIDEILTSLGADSVAQAMSVSVDSMQVKRDLETAKNNYDAQAEIVKTAQEAYATAVAEAEEKTEIYNKAVEVVNAKQKELDEANKNVEKEQGDVQKAESDVRVKQTEYDSATTAVNEASAEVSRLETQLRAATSEEEKATIRAELAKARIALQEAQAKQKAAETALNQANENLTNERNELKEAQERQSDAVEALEEAKNEAEEAEIIMIAANNAKDEAKATLDSENETLAPLKETLTTAQAAYDAKKAEVAELQAELQGLRSDRQEMVNEILDEADGTNLSRNKNLKVDFDEKGLIQISGLKNGESDNPEYTKSDIEAVVNGYFTASNDAEKCKYAQALVKITRETIVSNGTSTQVKAFDIAKKWLEENQEKK